MAESERKKKQKEANRKQNRLELLWDLDLKGQGYKEQGQNVPGLDLEGKKVSRELWHQYRGWGRASVLSQEQHRRILLGLLSHCNLNLLSRWTAFCTGSYTGGPVFASPLQ